MSFEKMTEEELQILEDDIYWVLMRRMLNLRNVGKKTLRRLAQRLIRNCLSYDGIKG